MSVTFRPLSEAIESISAKTPIGSKLRSREWEAMPLELRQRAMFSAAVESARFLQNAQDRIRRTLALEMEKVRRGEAFMDRSVFIAEMRKIAKDEGIYVDPAKRGGLQDITSRKRLGMIFDIQTESAREYARWKAEQDPDVLDAFPAQELIRLEERSIPRKWRERWAAAGGEFFGGRMIALKSDPIWRRINRFGVPWPPFDFNSGMGLADVDREEAERLGLIAPGAAPALAEDGFNDTLQASVRGLSPQIIRGLQGFFGEQIIVRDGVATWRGLFIQDFVSRALAEKDFKGKIGLGTATEATVEAARPHADLAGYELQLTADEARHAMARHGEGNETQGGQAGLIPADFAMVPELWRNPDSVEPGDKPGTLVFTKRLVGRLISVTWRMSAKHKTVFLQTLYKKKGEGAS